LEKDESFDVDAEWWALHNQIKRDNPEKAHDLLTRLKVKKMKEHSEIEVKGAPKLVVEIIDNSKPEVSDAPETT
jgi:hypothetical protein